MFKEIKEEIKDIHKGQEAINKSPTVFGKESNKLPQIEINGSNRRLNSAEKRISELEN